MTPVSSHPTAALLDHRDLETRRRAGRADDLDPSGGMALLDEIGARDHRRLGVA